MADRDTPTTRFLPTEWSICVLVHAVRELRYFEHMFAILPLFVRDRHLDSVIHATATLFRYPQLCLFWGLISFQNCKDATSED
eukprot:3878142-Prymnesium_polylepis.1